jgi:hypothetical protein
VDVPTIQEVLDQYLGGEYIAEELVLPSGEKIKLEEKDAADRKEA